MSRRTLFAARAAAPMLGLVALLLAGGCREPDIWGVAEVHEGETARADEERRFGPYLAALEALPFGLGEEQRSPGIEELRAFYAEHGLEPLWFAGPAVRGTARALVERLTGAASEGLDPGRYRSDVLGARLEAIGRRPAPEEVYELEVGLTTAAVLYAADLAGGRVRPEDLDGRWNVQQRTETDLLAWLAEAASAEDLGDHFARLTPHHQQYERLRQARDRYHEIVAGGGWPQVPRGPVVGAGEPLAAERRDALTRRLQVEGFLAPGAASTGATLSEELAAAVGRFQASRTLDVDGRLGPQTQEELNVPASDRLQQIELNLERWRWMPAELGDPAVVVNLPAYRLDLLAGGRREMTMHVVIGKPDWPTPIFSDEIEYLVLNPHWNVPESILEAEVLPQARRDPSYLERNDMQVLTGWGEGERVLPSSALLGGGEVVEPVVERDFWGRRRVVMERRPAPAVDRDALRVRQLPGPENPLGRVKFMFPNEDNVYLHDTPAGHHFSAADRYLSHGCVRLERPLDLAAYLLRGDGEWDRQRLTAAIDSGATRDVRLPREVPVHLVYFTAEVDEEGLVHFYEDVYGIDAEQAEVHLKIEGTAGSRPPSPA